MGRKEGREVSREGRNKRRYEGNEGGMEGMLRIVKKIPSVMVGDRTIKPEKRVF